MLTYGLIWVLLTPSLNRCKTESSSSSLLTDKWIKLGVSKQTEFTFAPTDVRFAAQNWRRLALQNEPTVSISTNGLDTGRKAVAPCLPPPPHLTPLATPLSGCVPKAAYQYGFLIQRLSIWVIVIQCASYQKIQDFGGKFMKYEINLITILYFLIFFPSVLHY